MLSDIKIHKKLILRIGLCLGSAFLFLCPRAQSISCKDSLKTVLMSSLALRPELIYQTLATSDNGNIIFQSTQLPEILSLTKLNQQSVPQWSEQISRNVQNNLPNENWEKIEQLSSLNYLISTNTYHAGCDTCSFSSHLFLDPSGVPLFQANYLNIEGDSGWQVSNSGLGHLIFFAGKRLVKNGGGISVSCQDTVMVEGNSYSFNQIWAHNYTVHNPSNTEISLSNIQIRDGNIYIGGTFSMVGARAENGIWMIKLDGKNGHLLSSKSYLINNPVNSIDSLLIVGPGQLTTSGTANFLYTIGILQSGENRQSTAFIRVDSSLHVLNNPTLISTALGIPCHSSIATDNYGKFSHFVQVSDSVYDYALIDNGNEILNQFKLTYVDSVMFPCQFTTNVNGNINAITTINKNNALYFQVANIPPGLVSNSDCISVVETNNFKSENIICSPNDMSWTETNDIEKYSILSPYPIPVANNVVTSSGTNCIQESICDSLKIQGPQNNCLSDSVAVFMASKNSQCLYKNNWAINADFQNTLNTINDSVVLLHFKSAGHGILYVKIPGCDLVDSFNISVTGLPLTPVLGNDTTLCAGSIDTLQIGSLYKTFLWQDGSENSYYVVKSAGKYSLTVTDFCGVIFTDSIKIKYDSVLANMPKTIEVCKNQEFVLSAADGLRNYQWQPIEFILGNANQKTVQLAVSKPASFTCTAINQLGCKWSDSFNVQLTNCLNQIIVPSAFTPNNDGVNDLIKPTVFGVLSNYEFQIFNRWGQLVFATSKQGEGWDGTLHGVTQGTQTFVWSCTYTFVGETEKNKNGTFILLR
jgi:gliding motility-associated-like protein